jgi:hypothetical protein
VAALAHGASPASSASIHRPVPSPERLESQDHIGLALEQVHKRRDIHWTPRGNRLAARVLDFLAPLACR